MGDVDVSQGRCTFRVHEQDFCARVFNDELNLFGGQSKIDGH